MGSRKPPRRRGLFCGLVAAVLAAPAAFGATVNWMPTAGGQWDVATNWSSNPSLPGSADAVSITSGTTVFTVTHSIGNDSILSLNSTRNLTLSGGSLAIAQASTITAAFTLSGGELTGAGNLTINGAVSWTDGVMSGAGTTLIPSTRTLSLANDVYTSLVLSRTLNNSGTVSGSSYRLFFKGGSFNNLAGGVFNATGTASMSDDSGTNAFNNAGAFNRSGSGSTTIAVPFNNSAAVNITGGTLALLGGGSQTGTFALSTGTRLVLGGDHVFAAGSTISGPFNIEISSGATTFPWATTVSSGSQLTLSGGMLWSSLNTTINGSLLWTGGGMAGQGATTLNNGASVTINTLNNPLSLRRTLNNYATINWTGGSYNPLGFDGATFNNRPGGIINSTGRTSIYNYTGANVFENEGIFNRSGADMTWIDVPFNNRGSVNIQAGTLALFGGGSHTGAFNFAANTKLWLGGAHFFSAGSTLSGATQVEVGYGDCTFDLSISLGSLALWGGNVTLASAGDHLLSVNSLSIANENFLDVKDNALLLRYSGTPPIANVQAWINNGLLLSSTVTATGEQNELAMVDNRRMRLLAWHGQAISDGSNFDQILVLSTCPGDVNLDGRVDSSDYYNIVANMGRTGMAWIDGDLDGNGLVNLADLEIVRTQLAGGVSASLSPVFARAGVPVAAVPEPAGLALGVVVGLLLCRRRSLGLSHD